MHVSRKAHTFRPFGLATRRRAGFPGICQSLALGPILTLALGASGGEATAWSVVESRSMSAILEPFEQAMARGDLRGAERVWQEAYVATLRGDWRANVRIGDAALRLGLAGGSPQVAVARARRSYLAALFRARAARSSEGAVHVAESFAALGDTDVVKQSLRVAEKLRPSATDATRLRALRARLDRTPSLPSAEAGPPSALRLVERPR